jgi:hypothetical protein
LKMKPRRFTHEVKKWHSLPQVLGLSSARRMISVRVKIK